MTREQGISLINETIEKLLKENEEIIERMYRNLKSTEIEHNLVNLQCSLNITTSIMTVGTILSCFLPKKEG